MASLSEAEEARSRFATKLAKGGVHAIGVASGKTYGKRGHVVVGYVAGDKEASLPENLSFRAEGGKTVSVPLVVERAEMFKAE